MARNSQDQSRPPPDHPKELLKLFVSLVYRHSAWRVFVDFNEAAAISLSNAVDLPQRDKREERYMQLIKRYQPDELARFPKMLGELTLALESEVSDVLGRSFHELELHNRWAGQFFSPYPLCRMMAKMTLIDEQSVRSKIAEGGFVRAHEPACGSGAMVIALAHEMRDFDINYQQHLHVTAVDVDVKCVHMAYVQLSLLHVPAVVVHGNSLSGEEFSRWHTPAHIIGGWDWKLHRTPSETPHEVNSIPQAPFRPTQPEPAPDKPSHPSQLTLF